ncbi:MAG: hypothetical protein DRJ05_10450 [Bacteroidetes bacterium]|nr:MAG: hypothetical protein DRJ05_10450 [Bacteroidota bacterium]
MSENLQDKTKVLKFFLKVFFAVLMFIVIKERFFYSGSKYSNDKALDWQGITENLPWYLIFSFFSTLLFTYVYIKKNK